MLTNDLTHGFAVDNLAMDETEEVERPRSGSVPAVQFADDSDKDSDKEVRGFFLYSINFVYEYLIGLPCNICINFFNQLLSGLDFQIFESVWLDCTYSSGPDFANRSPRMCRYEELWKLFKLFVSP